MHAIRRNVPPGLSRPYAARRHRGRAVRVPQAGARHGVAAVRRGTGLVPQCDWSRRAPRRAAACPGSWREHRALRQHFMAAAQQSSSVPVTPALQVIILPLLIFPKRRLSLPGRPAHAACALPRRGIFCVRPAAAHTHRPPSLPPLVSFVRADNGKLPLTRNCCYCCRPACAPGRGTAVFLLALLVLVVTQVLPARSLLPSFASIFGFGARMVPPSKLDANHTHVGQYTSMAIAHPVQRETFRCQNFMAAPTISSSRALVGAHVVVHGLQLHGVGSTDQRAWRGDGMKAETALL